MASPAVDWPRLKGQRLQTISGARFMVVRVTDQFVTIRPESGTRNYALRIADELGPLVAAFATSGHLPKPAELARLSVRPILASYAWGVLRAVLVAGASSFTPQPVADADFAGLWQIIDLPDLGPGYFEPEAGTPRLQIVTPNRERLRGNFRLAVCRRNRDRGVAEQWC